MGAAMTGPWFLERFERVLPAGEGKWRAKCPVCAGHRSLSVGEGHDRFLIYPYCKCEPKAVLEAVGLRFNDLRFEFTTARASYVSRPPGGCTYSGASVTRNPSFHRGEMEELFELHSEGKIDDLPTVELPPLPDDATEPMRRVAAFFQLVYALRTWADMPPEAPFAGDWVAAKLRIPPVTVWRALRRLEAAGVLKGAGSLPGRNGRRGPKMYVVGETCVQLETPPNVVRLKDRRAA